LLGVEVVLLLLLLLLETMELLNGDLLSLFFLVEDPPEEDFSVWVACFAC